MPEPLKQPAKCPDCGAVMDETPRVPVCHACRQMNATDDAYEQGRDA